MIFLWCLCLFILIIIILLSFTLTFDILYDEELKIKVKYIFFTFDILPKKLKDEDKIEKQKETNKQQKEKKDNKWYKTIKEIKDNFGIKYIKKIILKIIKIIKKFIKNIFKHIIIKKFKLHIYIAGEDAAHVAIKSGFISSVVYPIYTALINKSKNITDYFLEIKPEFLKEQTQFKLDLKFKIRPIFIVLNVLRLFGNITKLLFSIFINIKKNKKQNNFSFAKNN